MKIYYFISFGLVILACSTTSQQLPTVYEYFANSTTLTGLKTGNQRFSLNGKEIRITSGAVQYFRIHPDYWRDRLRKLRAVGANAVETYVPWNLHEPKMGQFDFGDGDNDFSMFIDVRRYLEMAKEEDLLVILRVGPFVNTEIDFGGLPSWLQRDPDMKVRQNYQPYLERVKIYFDQLLPHLHDLQFVHGGPIISMQLENEYANFEPRSYEYLHYLKELFDQHGFNETLYFTSDNDLGEDGLKGSTPGILQTANYHSPDRPIEILRKNFPDNPIMCTEFYVGWFNHWGDTVRNGRPINEILEVMERTFNESGSLNMYMFHGGTSFGFLAGANGKGEPPYIHPDITSYDWDAPVLEAGDYNPSKYDALSEIIEKYSIPKLKRPARPEESIKQAYPTIQPQRYLNYADLIDNVPSDAKFVMEHAVSMENLPLNDGSGQSFGYIIYRKVMPLSPDQDSVFKGTWPRDIAFLIVDGEQVRISNDTQEYWINSIKEVPLSVTQAGNHTVDLMVEPLGRISHGVAVEFIQQKGIAPIHESKIEMNGEEITNLTIIAMEFKNKWVKGLTGFREVENPSAPLSAPVFIESSFNITGEPADTWIDMSGWNKGIVFVNGFNIGRYWHIGPQQTLYIPAPLLKTGVNKVSVFEQVQPDTEIVFRDMPILGPWETSS